MMFKLSQLAKGMSAKLIGADVDVKNISTDTRSLQKGDIFLALRGEKFNGHEYINKAIEQGAGGLIVNKTTSVKEVKIPVLLVDDTLSAYAKIANMHRKTFTDVIITAVTGSCGKTTVKEMLVKILQQKGKVLYSKANYNNEIGLPATILQMDEQHKYSVLEMGARKPGDIKYLMDIADPKISLITKVAPAHLDTFKSLDGIAKTKGEIYQQLIANGTAILNVDDVYAPYWLSILDKQKVVTFSKNVDANIRATNIKHNSNGVCFDLSINETSMQVEMNVKGEHQVENALAASACAYAQDISIAEIVAGLESFTSVSGRSNFKVGKNGSLIIDDSYNANPVSVKSGLNVLAKEERKKKIFVFGDMKELGECSLNSHKEIGEYAKSKGISELFTLGDSAKNAVNTFGEKAKFFTNKDELIAILYERLDPSTVVLIKGSNSMKMDEIVAAVVQE